MGNHTHHSINVHLVNTYIYICRISSDLVHWVTSFNRGSCKEAIAKIIELILFQTHLDWGLYRITLCIDSNTSTTDQYIEQVFVKLSHVGSVYSNDNQIDLTISSFQCSKAVPIIYVLSIILITLFVL